MKIYKASAGSGKTYTLALEYIKELLVSPSNQAHRNILAVTFTKDATGEMKDRILAELYGLAFNCEDSKKFLNSLQEELTKNHRPMEEKVIRDKAKSVLQEILHDYSRLYITTIDSFFQKVLRNLARELGKGSKFNLEMNSFKVLSDAVSSMIENAHEKPQVLDWLTTYIEDRLEEGNNWRIDREILNFSRCIFDEYFQEHESVLKSQLEGNPKIFEQIWNQHTQIQKGCRDFFKTTYTGITKIIEQNNFSLGDFSRNGTVINLLKKLADGDFTTANPDSKTVQDCCVDAEKWAAGKSKNKDVITSLASSDLMLQLNQSLDMLRRFNTSRMITKNIHQLGLIWDITNEIEQQNAENNRFMLADTALFLNRMIDDSDAPFIYEKIGAEIRHVMIDEFQDTSRLQWKNFKVLLSNILADNYFSLIVGDVKQSIYRWRNGDWSILNNIENELSGSNVKTLEFNYRSEAEIIEFNNLVFTHAAKVLNEKYYSLFKDVYESPFETAYTPVNVVQHTHKTDKKGYISIDFISDKVEETAFGGSQLKYNDLVLERIPRQLQQLKKQGIAAEQICILTRTNKNIITIAEYLAAQKEQYPDLQKGNYLNVVSNEAFQLNSSIAVKIIITALRMLSDPENPVHEMQLNAFLSEQENSCSSLRGLCPKQTSLQTSLDCFVVPPRNDEPLKRYAEQSSEMPLFELIGHLFRSFGLEKIEGQSSYMFAFYDAVNNYLKDYPADIYTFLKFWDEELQFKSVPAGTVVEGIRAMTIHKSKGLQFHTVLLPYCDWDLYPEKNPIVWCGPKDNLYNLELLPVRYTQKMYDTVFFPEYEKETRQSWMDNLNVLYVAFTRSEHNLLVLAKNKKKLESLEDVKTVSDLLQYIVWELKGMYDSETFRFEKGILEPSVSKEEKKQDNLLKQTPETLEVSFLSEPFNPDKAIFKQSNKSREFIANDEAVTKRNEYIQRGNLMHELFSRINTLTDIERAVDQLCFDGLIAPDEKLYYTELVRNTIEKSGNSDWFSGDYQSYNECTILLKENGEVVTRRPDKVLIKDQKAIVIDYKFGEPHAAHQKQMNQYLELMKRMGYQNTEGHVWYIDINLN
ncbi:MAG: UvrD-helicase domain-containing protein [Dysgonamonadaceae bacterium]|jgi:ATP-dependent exoDNAse (exonuclease V) beta subunit|nr:UvrD-helicase domain-containing protein [Dysgonamonadaceae bacterium]